MKSLLLVGLGGGLGSISRYLCQKWINEVYFHTFPLATFLVNITGCLLIGILYAGAEKTTFITPTWRLLFATGFCGGFTTFSTFALENLTLLRSGDSLNVLLYAVGSLVIGLLAVGVGYSLIKLL